MSRVALAAALLAAAPLLAGCGQKGPLFLPDPVRQVVPAASVGAQSPTEPDSKRERKQPAGTPPP